MGFFDFLRPDVEKLKEKKDVAGLIKALYYKSDSYVMSDAAKALGEIGGSRAVGHLIAKLDSNYLLVHVNVEDALINIGKPAVNSLLAALKDKSGIVRDRAAKILGIIGDARAVEPLIFALKDSDASFRITVIEALGRIGGQRVIETLSASIKDLDDPYSDDHNIGRSAAVALGKIGDARAVEPLIQILHFGCGSYLPEDAIEALVNIGKPAVEPLITVLKDGEECSEVQGGAAVALGEIRDARAVEPLITLFIEKRDCIYLSGFIRHALINIGKPAVGCLFKELKNNESFVSREVVSILEDIGKPAVEPLIFALKNEDSIVRKNAILALEKIGDKRAVEPLKEVAKNDPEVFVCETAKSALFFSWKFK